MADTPDQNNNPLAGYKDIPEADRKKAQVFFDRAKAVADSGQMEYSIEMYIQGLKLDPESVDAHRALWEIALRRKVGGGKRMGFMESGRLPKGDDLQKMLNAEKQLAYDPSDTDLMVQMLTAAQKAGCYDTVLFIGPLLHQANSTQKKPSYSKFMTLKEVYKGIGRYHLAVEAIHSAIRLRPQDMDLLGEAKNLAAEATIQKGGYATSESFRGSIKDMDAQKQLLEGDKDVRSLDSLMMAIKDAKAAYEADPTDYAKLGKLVDALCRTEQMEYENHAIEFLDRAFTETRQYKFRQRIGQIQIAQLNRQDRRQREQLITNPNDAELRKQYAEFLKEKTEQELKIFEELIQNYPTDTTARFEMGRRMFALKRYEDALSVFQEVRNDPKYKAQATVLLGRSFLEAGFLDEASETLEGAINEYPIRGDERSQDMVYWYAFALEQRGDIPAAIKSYSQVFQWNAKFRDVQTRIRGLRNPGPDGGGGGKPGPSRPN